MKRWIEIKKVLHLSMLYQKKKNAICTKQIYYYYSIKQSQFFFYFFFYFELNNLNFPFIFSFILNLFLATLNYIKSYVCFYILKIFLKKNIFFPFWIVLIILNYIKSYVCFYILKAFLKKIKLFIFLFYFKLILFYVLKLFWHVNIKINFLK
jgi:hypothetical protein